MKYTSLWQLATLLIIASNTSVSVMSQSIFATFAMVVAIAAGLSEMGK